MCVSVGGMSICSQEKRNRPRLVVSIALPPRRAAIQRTLEVAAATGAVELQLRRHQPHLLLQIRRGIEWALVAAGASDQHRHLGVDLGLVDDEHLRREVPGCRRVDIEQPVTTRIEDLPALTVIPRMRPALSRDAAEIGMAPRSPMLDLALKDSLVIQPPGHAGPERGAAEKRPPVYGMGNGAVRQGKERHAIKISQQGQSLSVVESDMETLAFDISDGILRSGASQRHNVRRAGDGGETDAIGIGCTDDNW